LALLPVPARGSSDISNGGFPTRSSPEIGEVERADWPLWLGEEDGDVTALLRPLPADRLRIWPIERTVNNVGTMGRNYSCRAASRTGNPSKGRGKRRRRGVYRQLTVIPTRNHAAVDALLSRIGQEGAGVPEGVPAPVLGGMENLKVALRLRLRRGPLDPTAAKTIAAALDTAAQAVENA
jgi:hypothetical protein